MLCSLPEPTLLVLGRLRTTTARTRKRQLARRESICLCIDRILSARHLHQSTIYAECEEI